VVIKSQKDIPIVTDNIPTASPTPVETKLSCQDEISNLFTKNRDGIKEKLTQKKEYNWQGISYTGYVYNCPYDGRVFLLTKNQDKNEKIVFSFSDALIISTDLKDINNDGLAELTIHRSQGGNCMACSGFSVFQMVGDDFNDLLVNFPKSDEIKSTASSISDLNNDGVLNDKDELKIKKWAYKNVPVFSGLLKINNLTESIYNYQNK